MSLDRKKYKESKGPDGRRCRHPIHSKNGKWKGLHWKSMITMNLGNVDLGNVLMIPI